MMPDATLSPDAAQIKKHLAHITRRWGELNLPCMLEVVFLTAHDKAEVRHVARFNWDDAGLTEAAQHVADMNQHKLNAYAVVNPVDGMKTLTAGRRASTNDIVASFFHFADADDAQAAENIRNFVGPKCTFFVLTGTIPSPRPHVYWELEEPVFDMAEWSKRQATIAAVLKTDSVIDAPRIMRLGGTINWPKPKKQERGYVVELTTLKIYTPEERPPVSVERITRAFGGAAQPSLSQQATAGLQIDTGSRPASVDRERLAIQAMQGQEWHNAMIRLVASYVGKGLTDGEIHALTDPLTLSGYTVEQTRQEVQTAIDGARRKGWTPEQQYATPEALQPLPQPAQEASFDAPPRSIPPIEWFDDVAPALSDSYIVKGVLSQGAMSVVYGPSNSGKTFLALDLAFHVAIGAPWRGRRVAQCGVLYLAAEGGRGVSNRIAALKLETGVCDVPLALRRAGLDLLHNQANLQELVDLAGAVKEKFPELPLLIVIDTLSRIMAGGDENSAADMTALIRNIDAIREATSAHIMLVHHTGKDTARGARGHSSLRAATDTEIEVGNENGARCALVTKQRDYQGGETFAFTLKGVTLGHDQDGDEVTSCVVEAQDAEEYQAAVSQKKGLGGNQKLIADVFDQMLGDGLGKPNPGGTGMPESGKFWTVELEELRRLARGKMVATDTRSAFNQAMRVLASDRGLFGTGGNLVWRTDRKVTQ